MSEEAFELLRIAKEELKAENNRAEIEKIKAKLRLYKPFWQLILTFKIVIVRR